MQGKVASEADVSTQRPGLDALRRLLGSEPAAGLSALDEAALERLVALLRDSRQRQRQQLHAALERALAYVPALARGPVRRILFPEGSEP